MSIVVIKIGENEPEPYPRFDQLAHHGDIIEILPDGVPPGSNTEKEYLVVKVDTSGMTEEEYNEWRGNLLESVIEHEGERRCNICNHVFYDPHEQVEFCPMCDSLDVSQIEVIVHKRLYKLDIALAKFFDDETKTQIEAQTAIKRDIKPQLYQYKEDYIQEHGLMPASEDIAAYKKQLESDFDMKPISSDAAIPKAEFDGAVRNKVTKVIFGISG